jgi:exopolyphosphatase/guanosine-5'-triphosphate,3'-diphosphate pyrophosphatase
VIDLGSNTFHLAITALDEAGQIHVIDGQKENMRIAEAIEDGMIPERLFQRATEALLAMKSIGQSYKGEFRVVATQAIRAAHNRLAFIDHIQKTTGLKMEIIDGVEEARLSFLGVSQSLSFGTENLLSVDIGGASTEIAVGRGADCTYLSSLKMGALLLSKTYFFDKGHTADQLEELRQYVEARLTPIQVDLFGASVQNAAATSGTAKALARMIHQDRTRSELDDPHGFRFTAAELYAVEQELGKILHPDRIAVRWGLDSKRADIVLSGCVILATLTRLLQIPHWIVSTSGLREGVALDTYERKGLLPRAHWQDLRWQSVVGFAGKLRLDPAFAAQMSDLAVRVFDELVAFPAFADMSSDARLDRDLLLAAAYLLEAGKFINFTSYHRHSYYLITESNLLGYTQEEKNLIALINRFARKSPAKSSKSDSLPYLDRNLSRVNLLSSCLRIARCLLRTRQMKIQNLKITKQGGTYTLRMTTTPGSRMDAEKLALKKDAKSLEKALDCGFDFQFEAAGSKS